MSAGEAFLAGLGLGVGLLIGQHLLRDIGPSAEGITKRVIVCQKCAAGNSVDNKFCTNCGQSLYPPPKIKCQDCFSEISVTMKFCGNCGTALKR